MLLCYYSVMRKPANKNRLQILLIVVLLSFSGSLSLAITLPEFGDASSGIISINEERELGSQVLQEIRRSDVSHRDPQIYDYTELLLFKLGRFSQLKDRNFRLVLIDNPTINAFAVPGSVIGIHLGLFLESVREAEFAGVLAHEIAHLSQRHYARNTEVEKRRALPYLASIIGSMILLTQGGTDAGLAALHASQAAAAASRLHYSRKLEREADRVGIQTLFDAGFDPDGMAGMFTRMQQAARHNAKPPEFLLTHPLHESRIADAQNQAQQYPEKDYHDALNYHLMRSRVELVYKKADEAIKYFRKQFKDSANNPIIAAASRYGLALALIKKGESFDEAQLLIDQLLADRRKLTYQLLQIELWLAAKQNDLAINQLDRLSKIHTNNKSVTYFQAQALMRSERFKEAKQLLRKQVILYPKDVDLWSDLAEASGQAKDIPGVHRARAEMFLLQGEAEKAEQQIRSALRLISENTSLHHKLSHRLEQITEKE